ncbi:MAG: helicase-related protein, partial [Candidatus Limnocylindrales bacterium]
LPPGRTLVETVLRRSGERSSVYELVASEVGAGRQAYVVYPLVGESEKVDLLAATDEFERLRSEVFPDRRVGLLHGQLNAAAKDAVMRAFLAGEIDVLVTTTVIEVGIDVANATVMVVEHAERFGLAQLHQLRGRVGRGSERSWCYLVSRSDTPEAEARLGALVETTAGFALAEVDLELRGEGTIKGERQKGRNDLKLASLRRDREWVERAREVAFAIVDGEGGLEAHADLLDEVALFHDEDDQEFLLKG